MQHNRFRTAFMAATLLLTGTLVPQSQAAIAITGYQDGSDYVFNYTGSVTLDSNVFHIYNSETTNLGFMEPSRGVFGALFAPTGFVDYGEYAILGGLSGPSSFGTGFNAFTGNGTGDVFAMSVINNRLNLPLNYVSGAPLSGSMVFAGATAASLGLVEGGYTWNLPSDTISMNISASAPAAAPEPTRALLLMLGMGSLLLRRQRPSAPAQA